MIIDPVPREGEGFAIVPTRNRWGDEFLTYVVDQFPFVVQYDIHTWPVGTENLLSFEGIVSVWNLALT